MSILLSDYGDRIRRRVDELPTLVFKTLEDFDSYTTATPTPTYTPTPYTPLGPSALDLNMPGGLLTLLSEILQKDRAFDGLEIVGAAFASAASATPTPPQNTGASFNTYLRPENMPLLNQRQLFPLVYHYPNTTSNTLEEREHPFETPASVYSALNKAEASNNMKAYEDEIIRLYEHVCPVYSDDETLTNRWDLVVGDPVGRALNGWALSRITVNSYLPPATITTTDHLPMLKGGVTYKFPLDKVDPTDKFTFNMTPVPTNLPVRRSEPLQPGNDAPRHSERLIVDYGTATVTPSVYPTTGSWVELRMEGWCKAWVDGLDKDVPLVVGPARSYGYLNPGGFKMSGGPDLIHVADLWKPAGSTTPTPTYPPYSLPATGIFEHRLTEGMDPDHKNAFEVKDIVVRGVITSAVLTPTRTPTITRTPIITPTPTYGPTHTPTHTPTPRDLAVVAPNDASAVVPWYPIIPPSRPPNTPVHTPTHTPTPQDIAVMGPNNARVVVPWIPPTSTGTPTNTPIPTPTEVYGVWPTFARHFEYTVPSVGNIFEFGAQEGLWIDLHSQHPDRKLDFTHEIVVTFDVEYTLEWERPYYETLHSCTTAIPTPTPTPNITPITWPQVTNPSPTPTPHCNTLLTPQAGWDSTSRLIQESKANKEHFEVRFYVKGDTPYNPTAAAATATEQARTGLGYKKGLLLKSPTPITPQSPPDPCEKRNNFYIISDFALSLLGLSRSSCS
jgi:hypothetical protein